MRLGVVARVALVWLAFTSPAFAECAMVGPGCSLYDYRGIVFVGTVVDAMYPVYRMRVDEAFRGVKGRRSIEVLNVVYEGYSGFEGAGKQYLVFADPYSMDGKNYARLGDCARNMIEISHAHALVEQLRRRQQRQRVASLFGQVMRTAQNSSFRDPSYDKALANIPVTVRSGRDTVRTTTSPDGSFMFERLRPAQWVLTAELPPALAYLEPHAVTMDAERGDCIESDIGVWPTTRISGRVLGPDGIARTAPWVTLYRADAYPYVEKEPRTRGMDPVPPNDGDRFTFQAIAPGDYILVFGQEGRINPEYPFPLTFYPRAARLADATVIHLQDGRQIDDADIHVSAPRPTRVVDVVLDWNGRDPADYSRPDVLVKTDGYPPSPRPIGANTFRINVLIETKYEMAIGVSCRFARRQVFTETARVSGPSGADTLTLKFPPGDCR